LLIQASARIDHAAYADYIAEGIELPPADQLVTGAIIGSRRPLPLKDETLGGLAPMTLS